MDYQKQLWQDYADQYPDETERGRYVCNPYKAGAEIRCPHLTGGAVDVRIKGKLTNSQMTASDWKNLEDAMYSAGWVRYLPESWHFEYGTDRYDRAVQLRKKGEEGRAIV